MAQRLNNMDLASSLLLYITGVLQKIARHLSLQHSLNSRTVRRFPLKKPCLRQLSWSGKELLPDLHAPAPSHRQDCCSSGSHVPPDPQVFQPSTSQHKYKYKDVFITQNTAACSQIEHLRVSGNAGMSLDVLRNQYCLTSFTHLRHTGVHWHKDWNSLIYAKRETEHMFTFTLKQEGLGALTHLHPSYLTYQEEVFCGKLRLII